MFREKHGCNSMPPLRLPFNHKINTLSQKYQIFIEIFLNPFPVTHSAPHGAPSFIYRDIFLVSPEFCGSH